MLITVQDLAEDICEDIGDTGQKYWTTILKKVLQGYRELHLFVTPQVSIKSQILECSRVIPLPSDFVYETKIGVLRNQHIATLFLDKNLRLSKSDRVNMTQANTQIENYLNGIYIDGVTANVPFYNCFRGTEFVGELYGLGNGFHELGYYNINRTEKIIEVSVGVLPKGTELIIEYKSDGVPDGLKLIPTEAEMAVKYFAKMEYYADKNPSLSLMNSGKYMTAYNRLKELYNKRPIDFLGEIFVENHMSSPK